MHESVRSCKAERVREDTGVDRSDAGEEGGREGTPSAQCAPSMSLNI